MAVIFEPTAGPRFGPHPGHLVTVAGEGSGNVVPTVMDPAKRWAIRFDAGRGDAFDRGGRRGYNSSGGHRYLSCALGPDRLKIGPAKG